MSVIELNPNDTIVLKGVFMEVSKFAEASSSSAAQRVATNANDVLIVWGICCVVVLLGLFAAVFLIWKHCSSLAAQKNDLKEKEEKEKEEAKRKRQGDLMERYLNFLRDEAKEEEADEGKRERAAEEYKRALAYLISWSHEEKTGQIDKDKLFKEKAKSPEPPQPSE